MTTGGRLAGIFLVFLYIVWETWEKSVILLIGDGNGPNQIEGGSLIEYGPKGTPNYLRFPSVRPVRTYNVDGTTTDSAASATAISTGILTHNGYIGLDANQEQITNIVEKFHQAGKLTGVISKCHVTHATPAAFLAHVNNRFDYTVVAKDIADNRYADIILTSGAGEEFMGGQIGKMKDRGFKVPLTIGELNQISRTVDSLPVMGLFGTEYLDWWIDHDPRTSTQPTLSELVDFALDTFLGCDPEARPNGDCDFFLIIEGGLVDIGNHENNITRTLSESIEFDLVLGQIRNRISEEQKDNILVVVTADHESGGLTLTDLNGLAELADGQSELEHSAVSHPQRVERISALKNNYSTTAHTPSPVIVGTTWVDAGQSLLHIQDINRMIVSWGLDGLGENSEYEHDILPDPSNPSSKTVSIAVLCTAVILSAIIGAVVGVIATKTACCRRSLKSVKHEESAHFINEADVDEELQYVEEERKDTRHEQTTAEKRNNNVVIDEFYQVGESESISDPLSP